MAIALPIISTLMVTGGLLYWYGSTPLLTQQHRFSTDIAVLSSRTLEVELELNRMTSLASLRYDRLHFLITDLEHYLKALNQLIDSYLPNTPLKQEVTKANIALNRMRPLIDHALRHYTVAAASYNMLPSLAHPCFEETPPSSVQQTFLTNLLQSPVMVHNDPAFLKQLAQQQATFEQTLPPTTSCERLNHHSQMFLEHFAKLLSITQRLSTISLGKLLDTINAQFHQHVQQAITHQQHIKHWLIGLVIAIGLILLLVLHILQRQLHRLEHQQNEITKLNRLYQALSGLNHAIVRAEHVNELYERSARILGEKLDIPGVTILNQPDQSGRLQIQTLILKRPQDHDILNQTELHISINPTLPEGQGIVAQAWHQGHVYYANDYQSDARFAPWLPLAKKLGIHTAVAIPLQAFGKTQAVILLYHYEKNWVDQQVLDLLEEVRDDLSFALERLELLKQQQRQKIQLQLAEVAFNAHEGIAIATANGELVRSNHALMEMSGYSSEELLNRRLDTLLEPQSTLNKALEALPDQGYWQGELRLRSKSGQIRPTRAALTWVVPQLDTNSDTSPLTASAYIVVQLLDLSQVEALEEQLRQSQMTDPITGLPNRQALLQSLQQILDHIMPEESWGVLSIINIRHFKAVNDTLGHQGGDELLKQVGQRLHERLAFPHLTARDANDEFVIMPLVFYPDRESAQTQWQQQFAEIEALLMRPITINDHQVQIEIYAGTTFFTPRDIPDAETLLNQAESATRQAKTNRMLQQFYDRDSNQAAAKLITLRHQLEQALQKQELILHYQPILDLSNRQVSLAEALLRWRSDEKLISPAEFMPVLEQSPQLMIRIGRWIIDQAMAQCSQISHALGQSFHISINLSAVQFHDPTLIQTLSAAARREGVQPGQITLEVTETILVSNLEHASSILSTLKSAGFQIAIDDFGTGYSSLQYLQRFAANKIKLDKTFVTPLNSNEPKARAIPEATIAMAHVLGAQVIAEGVETEKQLNLLEAMACDFIQGYHLAKPMPLEDLIPWLKSHQT